MPDSKPWGWVQAIGKGGRRYGAGTGVSAAMDTYVGRSPSKTYIIYLDTVSLITKFESSGGVQQSVLEPAGTIPLSVCCI